MTVMCYCTSLECPGRTTDQHCLAPACVAHPCRPSLLDTGQDLTQPFLSDGHGRFGNRQAKYVIVGRRIRQQIGVDDHSADA